MLLLRLFAFGLGAALVAYVVVSATRNFVLPRSAPDVLSRTVFVIIRRLFHIGMRGLTAYADRDRVLALFAPFSLLALPPVWLALVAIGYAGMFWAIGEAPWDAFRISGSSLLTLGIQSVDTPFGTLLMFSEAALGLILAALLISYLPTMYSAFSQRETLVTTLAMRAGTPPSAVEILVRYHQYLNLSQLTELWVVWEGWFAQLVESHTSLPALAFYRSPDPDHSWVTAAGAVMDAAALTVSAVEVETDTKAVVCVWMGYVALQRIANYFNIPYDPDPKPDDPISLRRDEFEAACEALAKAGLPLKADRDQAWRDFAGWRVNYDAVLLGLCTMTNAPMAPWSSDRAPEFTPPPLWRPRRRAS